MVFEVDQEQEKQSVVRHETSNADPDNTSNKLSNIKQSENECNSITDQAASSAIEDTTQMNKEDIEQFVNGEFLSFHDLLKPFHLYALARWNNSNM